MTQRQAALIIAVILGALVLGALVALAVGHISIGAVEINPVLLWSDTLPASKRKIALLAGGGATLAAIAGALLRRPRADVHGRARFATESEIADNGLRDPNGLILGRKGGRLLRFCGQEHVVVYAPTRSGKGVGVVIPNLLNWSESVIVLDIKKENWDITAGFRARAGQKVFLFDPGDPSGRTHRYNPLGFVRLTDRLMVNDLQNIATILFPAEGKKEPFWDLSAQKLFTAVAGTIAIRGDRPLTLGEIFRAMTAAPKFQDTLARWSRADHAADRRWPPIASLLNDLVGMSESVFGSVFSTATAVLSAYGANALLDAATSACDFDLNRLRQDKMSIYVGVTPNNLKQLGALVRLLFEQATNLTVAGGLPAPGDHTCLLLLDEFTAPGPLPAIAHGFGFFAGYGLRMLLIVQSPSQLETTYDRSGRETIMGNCGVEVVYPPKELSVAKELSERIGFRGVEARSRSKPLSWASRRDSGSESVSEQRRAVLLPQELMQLDRDKLLLLRGGMPAVLADKIAYYKDPAFKTRLVPAPLVPEVDGATAPAGALLPPAGVPAPASDTAQVLAALQTLQAQMTELRERMAPVKLTDDELLERKPIDFRRILPTPTNTPVRKPVMSEQEAMSMVDSIFDAARSAA